MILFDISSNKAEELLIHVGFANTIAMLLYGLLGWIKLRWYISDSELFSLTTSTGFLVPGKLQMY